MSRVARGQKNNGNGLGETSIRFVPNPGPEVRPGRAFEVRVLAVSEKQPNKNSFKEPREPTLYERAQKEAVQNQPGNWNPCSPTTELAQKIFGVVYTEIQKRHPKLLTLFTLKLYNTVDTELDRHFGVDFLFRLEDQFGNSYASASMDLTISLRKLSNRGGANFAVFPTDFLPGKLDKMGKMICFHLATCIVTRSNGCVGDRRPHHELLLPE